MKNQPDIRVEENGAYSDEQLVALYNSVGWIAYTASGRREHLGRAIANSTFVVSAWDGDDLIALLRALSDDVSVAFIQDILVHPDYRRRNVGTDMMERCLDRFAHVRTILLFTDDREEQKKFYEAQGFTNTRGMPANTYVIMKNP